MTNVFVIQEQPKFDISPALRFGKIRVILPPGDTNFSYQYVERKLRFALKSEAQLGDFLLLSGDPVAIGLATVVMRETLGKTAPLNFLKWMPRECQYHPITIELRP